MLHLAVACVIAFGSSHAFAGDTLKGRTLDGVPVMLSDYFEPGKWTLVMLWTTYCGVCKKQYPIISAFNATHHDKDVKVIGISLDGYRHVDRVRKYIAARQPTFVSIVGEVADVKSSFEEATGEDFAGTPTYLLFNTQGELAGQTVGPVKPTAIEHFIQQNPG